MPQVVDYSGGFPGAQAILNGGFAGAVRYIGFPDRSKCTTESELVDFSVHQLGMALTFESGIDDWRGGFAQGVTYGRLARDHATSIGFPATRPIYMTVDDDVAPTDFGIVLDYLRGAGAALGGPGLTGVYAKADLIDQARDAGVAAWFWQTAAWSGGRRTPAHLFQNIGSFTVGGVACDLNDVNAPDWGQHTVRPARRGFAEDHTMQLQPGTEMSQTLTYPGNGFELVINIGWVTMDVNKISFIGRPPEIGVNWAGTDAGPWRIEPARPLVIDLDQYPNAVSIEINYSAPDTRNLASAGFRAK